MDDQKKGKVEIKYSEDLVMAVKYLIGKGLNSRKIAERLGISPYTVRSIKRILRKRGLLKSEKSKNVREENKPKNIIEFLKERRTSVVKDKSKS